MTPIICVNNFILLTSKIK